MVFDPSKSDKQRICQEIDEKYEDAFVHISGKYDQLKVEHEDREVAEKIKENLESKGLDVQLSNFDGYYEVTADNDLWTQ